MFFVRYFEIKNRVINGKSIMSFGLCKTRNKKYVLIAIIITINIDHRESLKKIVLNTLILALITFLKALRSFDRSLLNTTKNNNSIVTNIKTKIMSKVLIFS